MAGIAQKRSRSPFGFLRRDTTASVEDRAEAIAAFERFVALERAYDPELVDLYAADGVVIEVTAEGEEERRRREIPMRRYRAALPYALMLSKKAGEHAEHQNVEAEWIAPGWVVVRSRRVSSQSRAPGPYEATFRRDADGRWRIVKEAATLVR